MSQETRRTLGYARVSTQGQDLSYQVEKLKAAGCTKVFQEKRSGKNTRDRPQLNKLLKALRPDDLLLATLTDRVARDPLDLLNILQAVKRSGAALRLLDEPFIDTTSELGDLVMFLIGWAARWQRQRILENTARGREMARRRGVKFGRPRKLSKQKTLEIQRLKANGYSPAQLAEKYSVSQTTIRRLQPPSPVKSARRL